MIKMENSLKYWHKRCELAEDFINKSPDDPDVTNDQFEAYLKWRKFKESAKIQLNQRRNNHVRTNTTRR